MKAVDVKPGTYIDSSKEIIDKDPKFKIGDIVKTSKYKKKIAKKYLKIGMKKFLLSKTLKVYY